MPTRLIPYIKIVVHLLCLAPFLYLLQQYRSGALFLYADPTALITHFTGNWAVYMLLASLAITPVRRLSPKLGNLIRFRRMLGSVCVLLCDAAPLYLCVSVSGYDLPTVIDGVRAGHIGAIVDQWKVVWPPILVDLKEAAVYPGGTAGLGDPAGACADFAGVHAAVARRQELAASCTGWCMWRRLRR